LTRVRRGRVPVYGLEAEVAGGSMDRVKDYDTKQSRPFARSHAGHIAREVIAIDLNPSDVALA
jgi:hypothetical protein